jgi:hypothetical protein
LRSIILEKSVITRNEINGHPRNVLHGGKALEEFLEVFAAQVTIEENFRQKAGPDNFA